MAVNSGEEWERWTWAVKLFFWGVISMVLSTIGIERVCHIVAARNGWNAELEFIYLLWIQPYLLLPAAVLICAILYAAISIFHRRGKQAIKEFLIGLAISIFIFLMFAALF